MFIFLVIVITLIGIVMSLLVLIQSGKGGGLAGIAAGGATTQILGTRQAPDVLEKATWVLAALFIGLCVLTNFTIDEEAQQRSIIQQQQSQQEAPTPLAPLPQDAQGGAATPDNAQPTPPPSSDTQGQDN